MLNEACNGLEGGKSESPPAWKRDETGGGPSLLQLGWVVERRSVKPISLVGKRKVDNDELDDNCSVKTKARQ